MASPAEVYGARIAPHCPPGPVAPAAGRAADKEGHAWRNPVWHHEDGSFAEW